MLTWLNNNSSNSKKKIRDYYNIILKHKKNLYMKNKQKKPNSSRPNYQSRNSLKETKHLKVKYNDSVALLKLSKRNSKEKWNWCYLK
jgi:hypothetical protein